MEKIDILLTTYNSNIKFLQKQIDSILNQTYTDFNLLISDDCSQNKEVIEILKKYKLQDERISLFLQEKNLGYNKNFEFLLKQSKADYVAFADHDDIWDDTKIEKSINILKKKDVDLIYCNARQINEEDIVINQDYFKYKNVPLINGKNNKLAISRCIGIGCSQLITKNVKEKMIPFTDEVIAHDWLAAFIANEKKGITYIKEPLFGYRLHNTNVFGGRNLAQNLYLWKKEHGNSYKSFLEYRNIKVIDTAYLKGIQMCKQYTQNDKIKKYITDMEKYYINVKKSKYINFHIVKYFRYLSGKNLLKKIIKELIMFHIPILGYVRYRVK